MNEIALLHTIQMIRLDILAHSYIYYAEYDSIIPDYKWDAMLQKLIDLQHQHPDVAKEARYATEFMEYDSVCGCSGILTSEFLEAHPEVKRRARELQEGDQ